MVKTLSAHLKDQNPKYPSQSSKPQVPTSKATTQTAPLKSENPKCVP